MENRAGCNRCCVTGYIHCKRHTTYCGFTHFGFRDYDPQVGRFTAKDPLGDTGGDHDLYDYCVDDPVSCNDPTGLWALPLWALYAGGKLGALALGVGVPYVAAKGVDEITSMRTGNLSTAAQDAVVKVIPHVVSATGKAFLPRDIAMGAVTKGITGVGAALAPRAMWEFAKKSKDNFMSYGVDNNE